MGHRAADVANFLKDRELSYLLRPIRVNVKGSAETIVALGAAGTPGTQELPRWQAEALAEEGIAELAEETFDLELSKAASRERIQGNDQISTMHPDFYLRMRRHLGSLLAKAEGNGTRMEEYRRVSVLAYDLLTIRTSKILRFAASSTAPQDLFTKITPEEKLLFDHIHGIVDAWRRSVLNGVV